MGEIADLIINGVICQCCMQPLENQLFEPALCIDCKSLSDFQDISDNHKKINCKVCNKRVKKTGLKDHMRVVHKK